MTVAIRLATWIAGVLMLSGSFLLARHDPNFGRLTASGFLMTGARFALATWGAHLWWGATRGPSQ